MPVKATKTRSETRAQPPALRQEASRSLPYDFLRRIGLCRGVVPTASNPHGIGPTENRWSNCIGTALYIVGEQEKEESKSELPKLTRISHPIPGCLIVFEGRHYTDVHHAGVITSVHPLLIAHRTFPNCPFLENQQLSAVGRFYLSTKKIKPYFYLPKKLEQTVQA